MSNTIEKSTTSTLNDSIRNVMKLVAKSYGNSADLLDKNITDSNYRWIHEFITDPLSSSARSINNATDRISDVISRMLKMFFSSNQDEIIAVYKGNNNERYLQYFIVLKNDSIETRGLFNEFLIMYENLTVNNHQSSRLSDLLPLHFEYIPKDIALELTEVEEINFTDESLLQQSD